MKADGGDKVQAPDDLPRSPSGRIPAWVVEQHVQGRVADTQWRAYHPPEPARARRRGRHVFRMLVGLAFAGALVGIALGTGGLTRTAPSGALRGGSDRPTPGKEESDRALGAPARRTPASAAFGFTLSQEGSAAPVTYDPCRPIHYVTRTTGAPRGGAAVIAAAIQRLSAATGLRLVDDGQTDEAPSRQRRPFQPERYGDRWAPVLIAWETAAQNADFATDVAGEAGSQAIGSAGKPSVYVTGQVQLDGGKLGGHLTDPAGREEARAIVLHELGHLVGLAHVKDPSQIMFPMARPGVTEYAPGDLTGLARLGAGGCAPWL